MSEMQRANGDVERLGDGGSAKVRIIQVILDVPAGPYDQRLAGAAGNRLLRSGDEGRFEGVEEGLGGNGQIRVGQVVELARDGL
nr:hypothetical protein [Streptomyces sp. NRRL S-646]